MKIACSTIAELANKGIVVKYYPTGLEGLRKDTYNKRIEYILSFHDGQQVYWRVHYIDQNTSLQEIQEYAKDYVEKYIFMGSRDFEYHESRRWYEATTLYIEYDGKTL